MTGARVDRSTPGVFRAPGGVVVHLYLPGYIQGAKQRHPSEAGMCAAATTKAVWLNGVPSPRPEQPLRWCPKCLGLAMARFGLLDRAVELITPYFRAGCNTTGED